MNDMKLRFIILLLAVVIVGLSMVMVQVEQLGDMLNNQQALLEEVTK